MENQRGYAGNLGGNAENAQNHYEEASKLGKNVGIAVEITWNSSGNDKLKAWREVKIIGNEHICKNLIFKHLIWCLSS